MVGSGLRWIVYLGNWVSRLCELNEWGTGFGLLVYVMN